MKCTIKSLVIFLASALLVSSCTQDKKESTDTMSPAAFNNQIVHLQFELYQQLTQFMESVSIYDTLSIQATYNKLSETCTNSMASLDTLPKTADFHGYWQAANKLFAFYNETILKEYSNIVDLLLKPTELITEEQLAHIDSVSQNMTNKGTSRSRKQI